MTANSHRETAKIYQFPVGGRAALRADARVVAPSEDLATPPRASRVVFGGSWYHDAAIQEAAEQPRKR